MDDLTTLLINHVELAFPDLNKRKRQLAKQNAIMCASVLLMGMAELYKVPPPRRRQRKPAWFNEAMKARET